MCFLTEYLVVIASSQNIVASNGSTAGSKITAPSTVDNNQGTVNTSQPETPHKINKTEVETNIKLPMDMDHSAAARSTETPVSSNGTFNGRRLLEDTKSQVLQEGASESNANDKKDVQGATVENNEGLESEADQSFELFRDNDELPDEYSYDYDDYVDESLWGDEDWTEAQHEKLEDYVNIDAHVLCTPVSLDLTAL